MKVLVVLLMLWPAFPAAAATRGQEVVWNQGVSRFVVRLTFSGQNFRTFCTGPLISNREVLTAGHCLVGPIAPFLQAGAIFAEVVNETGGGVRRIALASTKSRFFGLIDVAVAVLSEDAGLGPAEFPTIATAPCSKRRPLFSYGFGIDENSQIATEPKMTIYEEIEGNEEMIVGFSPHAALGRNCFGDSGGPVICEQYGRPVIASVNSRISPGLFDALRFLLGQLSPGELCARTSEIYGTRLHTSKELIKQLRSGR